MLWCIVTRSKLYPNKNSSFEPFPDSVGTDTTWGSKKCINGDSRVTTMYKSQKHLHKRCVIQCSQKILIEVCWGWWKHAWQRKKSFYFRLSWTDFSATISVKGNTTFLQLCKITKKVRNMAKINHFLSEHILVTSSFSTVFIVPSRVCCITVTCVWSERKNLTLIKKKSWSNQKTGLCVITNKVWKVHKWTVVCSGP